MTNPFRTLAIDPRVLGEDARRDAANFALRHDLSPAAASQVFKVKQREEAFALLAHIATEATDLGALKDVVHDLALLGASVS